MTKEEDGYAGRNGTDREQKGWFAKRDKSKKGEKYGEIYLKADQGIKMNRDRSNREEGKKWSKSCANIFIP